MTAPVSVSVVVPVLDAAGTIEQCLDALQAQVGAPRWEVVVVDNGSTDATAQVVRRHPIGARLLQEPARGPYAARNRGIEHAAGAIVAFTDADCVPNPRWIAEGVEAVHAGAHLVGGRIVQGASPRPTIWERYDRALYLDQEEYVSNQRFAATGNLFVRADVVRDVGAFRPELTASGDYEFGRRATAAGYRLVYSDQAWVLHHPRTTFRDTWALHRKLGAGFKELARIGLRERPWRDRGLRIRYGTVVEAVAADGPYIRFRELAPVHTVAMLARWIGRVTGRP